MRPVAFAATASVITIADLVTKAVVLGALGFGETRFVLGRWLALSPTVNTGGAFSLLQTRNWVFIVVASVAIVALSYAYSRLDRRDAWTSAALALALGGAVGNLYDRLRFGYVRDFLDLRSNGGANNVWPIFNIADSAISCGIVILMIRFMLGGRARPDDAATGTQDQAGST